MGGESGDFDGWVEVVGCGFDGLIQVIWVEVVGCGWIMDCI